ncbi:MAG: diaminopimelate decarboxylase [Candidatus Accumulibacter phosphatis]|uniref:Diaminopimelate decarboxylase n=2 Tax=Candidatus Accumulibacter TaxID=327159 RepID=A0A080MHT7_9PROT|nr:MULTISPECIES: diaminopimelate decarboxylase [Candidatus Accumulibacter]KFB76799.1 MAG: Diaminopimelate decarboxylase [Candidatus Accumulibacter cognatus]MBL8400909.1 diaminopimelate decarboxylase [Accumulibacter sp.]MBO3712551.1 diaminopimelate decarboxylase [Accumulibacter sp.]MCC2866179.1 diaminopimelate decarboxylase [Candidatus Accumulibacter phosphatis]MCM8620485.1 diaminopimelate decarboxylase [Accumulibacter sp.]
MSPFARQNGVLHAESVSLIDIASHFGTPCWVYSRHALETAFDEFQQELIGLDSLICYAVKANSNLAVLDIFARRGAGFDIVSAGELKRVLAAGANPRKIVFSGVGKTAAEMELALGIGILCFNVESAAELERLDAVAGRAGKKAPISLRVNPDVDAKTHPYISTGLKENKFGVACADARALYRHAATLANLEITGIDCHIGSQLLHPAPFDEALDKLLLLIDQLTADGIVLHHIDLGGGLGIRYRDEEAPTVKAYLQPMLEKLKERQLQVLLEPGRRLVGNAGLLLTRVEYLKPGEIRNFAIVDAAMNDLARPALYGSWHDIVPVAPRSGIASLWDIVGPVCESGDFLGHGRPLALAAGDLLAILSAGAYGMVMSSNYNTRPRAAEVMVDGAAANLVRRRETVEELYALEQRLP